jgi:gluconate 5-dehydrogenase
MSSLFDLTGRTALVTGSSRGIGHALARALADAGATVVLNGLNAERLKAAEAAMAAEYPPGRVHSCAFDVTKDTEAAEAVSWVEENVGPLEILVNNAGIQHRVPMLELELSDWERVISTDLTSAFLVGREAARHMIPRGRGKIINICSVQTDLARPTIAPYIAAKGGLRNLTRAMTAEWAASGLQINGIAPGYIHTEMTQNLVDVEAFNTWILGRTPAQRWGTVQDLAGPTVWLASDGSNFVNGQTIFIDGGMTVVV